MTLPVEPLAWCTHRVPAVECDEHAPYWTEVGDPPGLGTLALVVGLGLASSSIAVGVLAGIGIAGWRLARAILPLG